MDREGKVVEGRVGEGLDCLPTRPSNLRAMYIMHVNLHYYIIQQFVIYFWSTSEPITV